MANSTPFPAEQRDALRDVLLRFGASLDQFEKLRVDSFEQVIARHSLEHLEQLYTAVLTPGMKSDEAREFCPPWPPGTKLAGNLPSTWVVDQVSERLRKDAHLNDLGRVSRFMESLRLRGSVLPVANQGEVLDTLVMMAGEEMLAEKLAGGSVKENVDLLDRLLIAKSAKTKAAQEEIKIKLREKAEARQREKLQFDVSKFQFDAAKLCLKFLPQLRAIAQDKNINERERVDKARQLLFGELPPSQPKEVVL